VMCGYTPIDINGDTKGTKESFFSLPGS